MFGLKQFFKKLLKDDTKKVEQKVAVEALRNAFTNRYLNFKTLLSTNNKVSELIAEMEQTFSGSRTFDMSFIRANCTTISVNTYKIISCLNKIANDKYKELPRVLEDILLKIDRELQQKKLETEGELVILLESIDKTMADHVGAKMANLGKEAEKTSLMKGSPVHNTLGNVLKYIAPLNLTDPDASDFTPEGCRTIHDIIRFAHEMSSREFFDCRKKEAFCPGKIARRLVIDIPMQWWVVDIDGGFRKGIAGGDTVGLEDIRSAPMLTLWEGITAVPWKCPPVDTKGFLSVMFSATMDRSFVPGMRPRYAVRNYFIISKNFCHLSSRFGFHFSTVEASFGQKSEENYLCFSFNGGGADPVRKARRANLIKIILEKFDFWVEVKDDLVFAWLEGYKEKYLEDKLKILGHLVMHTRQLDMVLSNSGRVNKYLEKILKEIASFVDVSQ